MRGNVQTIRPEVRDIHAPAPLRDKPLWCVWAYEQHPEEAKPRKVPQYTHGGRRYGKQGSPEDLAKLTTFALARDAAARRGLDGVGFALTADCGIIALDFDNCVTDGAVNPIVSDLVRGTYAEYSPSGKGVRAFFRGNLGNRKALDGVDGFGMETFSTSGFVTVTGRMLPFVDLLGHEDTIAKVTPEVEAYCLKRFGSSTPLQPDAVDFMAGYEPKLGLSVDESYDLLQQLDPDMGREDWIRVGMALHHEYSGEEEGFELWNDWSALGSKYPSDEALRVQWDSFTRRVGPGRKQITMASVKHMVKLEQPVSEQALKAVAESTAVASHLDDFEGKFRPVRGGQLAATLPEASWLIKGVLPRSLDPAILFGASGAGKAQPLDELVLTDRGWSTMGEIRVGDFVIGSAGLPVCVRAVHPQGLKDEWELTLSNGETVRCCGEHLWTVRRPGNGWQTLTTETLAKRWAPRSRWQLPIVAPVSFAHDPNPLPLDPYLLGALLGDGGITAYVGFTSADQEIVDEVRKALPAGHDLVARRGPYAYQIVTPRGQPNHVWTALRLLGLAGGKSDTKFVPEEYMRASPSARLALLQGLMDTDGYAGDGNGRTAVFSSASRQLTEQVAELVKSLGGLCNPIKTKSTKGLPAYIVAFRLCEGAVPFRLRRKAERCNRGGLKLHLSVVSIRRTGRTVPMQCITVDANDHLYVTTGFTLTHNSFVALDMACAIARGIEWRGRRVAKGRVLYIAAEGGAGIGKRLRAYSDHHQIPVGDLDVDVVTAAPNLLEQDDVSEIVKTISGCGPYDVVFVDTLAQTTPGANENAGEDMGRVLANIKAIQAATGATVVAVHHAGKDLARGSRGWSGIKAAAEAQLEVVRDEDNGQRYMRVEKMKDGEDGERFGFKLEILQVGVDREGDAITSCAVVPTDVVVAEKETGKGLKRRGRIENHILEVLTLVETDKQTITLDELVRRAADMLPPPEEGKRDTRRQHVTRAIQMLSKEKDGPISMNGNLVVLYQ